MNLTEEKNRIKNAIDRIENPETLGKISAILYGNEDTLITDDQLSIVKERREAYLKNPSELITLEEFKANIKKKIWVLN